MGQAVPEIPLSIGSKLELLRAFVFAKFPYTSPYTHAFVRICILLCILYTGIQCIYVYNIYTGVPRVLHFSAFIKYGNGMVKASPYYNCTFGFNICTTDISDHKTS